MSSHKRRLPQQNDHSVESGEPVRKRQKLESQTYEEYEYDVMSMFYYRVNIRDTILDHLSFSNENASLFIEFANDDYFKRRLLNLAKNDVINIKQMINNSNNKSTKYDLNSLCIFYANIKCLFGTDSFQQLLNITLKDNINPTDTVITDLKKYVSNDLTFFDSMTIKFKSPKDITNIFNKKQKLFLEKNNINLSNCTKFKIQMLESPDTNYKYEILPQNNTDLDSSRITYHTLGFAFNSHAKPKILTFPIANDFQQKKEIHTNNLLPSIERIFIFRNANSANSDNIYNQHVLHLYLDHNNEQSKLNKIYIWAKTNNDFCVNIKASMAFADDFEILNIGNKCEIKFNLFSDFPLKITQNEIDFIQQCKTTESVSFNDFVVQYNNQFVVQNGLINVSCAGDTYFFRINKNLELELYGYGIASLSRQNTTKVIFTSDIPLHWKIMRFGKEFCPLQALLTWGNNDDKDDKLIVAMDGFSNNIEEFSITQKNISLCVDIDYDMIPDNMKTIRLPDCDYDFIMEQFPFFIDKTLSAQDLVYKQIEFRFYEMLFSGCVTAREIYSEDEFIDADDGYENNGTLEISETCLEKLINPVFDTKYENEIIIFRRKNDNDIIDSV